MSLLRGARRLALTPPVIGFGVLLAVVVLLIAGWLIWSVLRPAPAGFAPTTGRANAVVGGQPGIRQYTVDARSRRNWVYFDFSSGTTVSTAQDALDWDLAFRRTDILTNSGETNPAGQGGAVDLGKVDLREARAPGDGYLADVIDDERGLENPVLHRWYNYDWIKHIVTSKQHTYAVRTATGEVVLLTFLSYYCDDGSSGCVTFQYKDATAP